ncbi:GNAT family N-acetyltransferase [Nakamurella antarctica]|uniref:GNAT family N-acetyltransferase n=1 Tax=Nakamurella antarctica TaxID=1902245 RepID=A0A3G8ZLI8_9ACTN|nr:GNAT family N-acetyltransferase [Nakamurella antarctica]AZI58080.1 GNAT family N-acetyltransferase [Nakamurella antarctica]
MAQAEVRPAIAGDGLAIASIQLEIWQAAFAHLLPAQTLELPPATLASAWTQALSADRSAVQVAAEGRQMTGFVHALLASSDDDPLGITAPVGEIRVLYVRPAWARRGHGGRLVAAAAGYLRALGASDGQWWVPETDAATASFVGSIGWQQSGEARILDTGKTQMREVLWVGSLDLAVG